MLSKLFLLITFFLFLVPSVEYPAEAPGTITFIGNAGNDNVFTVNEWKFDRVENLDEVEQIGITATLNMASITCEWKDLEKNLHKKKDYFYSKKFANATLVVDGAERLADGSYRTEAALTLKGVTKRVPIDFTLTGDGPYQLHAEATIDRRDFKFTGEGPKDEVPVTVDAELN